MHCGGGADSKQSADWRGGDITRAGPSGSWEEFRRRSSGRGAFVVYPDAGLVRGGVLLPREGGVAAQRVRAGGVVEDVDGRTILEAADRVGARLNAGGAGVRGVALYLDTLDGDGGAGLTSRELVRESEDWMDELGRSIEAALDLAGVLLTIPLDTDLKLPGTGPGS